MKVSKQALWQRQQIALGLCPICAEPKSATSVRCEKHRLECNRRNQERLKDPKVRKYHKRKAREWRKANPERARKLTDNWLKKNPGYASKHYVKNKGKIKEYVHRWQKENPDKVREYQARWRANNPERVKELRARWLAANPDYYKKRNRARHQATYQRKKG